MIKESACQCRRCRFNPWVGNIPWRRKWQPTPVSLPGKSRGQRRLVGYSPWGVAVTKSQTRLSISMKQGVITVPATSLPAWCYSPQCWGSERNLFRAACSRTVPVARGGGSESLGWGFAPPGIWDLVRVHILTRSQFQHIAVGVAGEQQGSLATHQVLPSFSLSSCHTNGILYIVLCLFIGMNKSGDCAGGFPLRR